MKAATDTEIAARKKTEVIMKEASEMTEKLANAEASAKTNQAKTTKCCGCVDFKCTPNRTVKKMTTEIEHVKHEQEMQWATYKEKSE
jgi:DNA-binding protein YbaB